MALSKDELLQMSERSFAVAYSRIMKLEKPVQRMKPTEEVVERVMEKLAEEGEVLNEKAVLEEENASATTPFSSTDASESTEADTASIDRGKEAARSSDAPPPSQSKVKGIGMSTTKSANGTTKKKLSGAAAAKKKGAVETAKKIVPPSNKENPYREGSMKAKCFEVFKKGGERGKIIEAIRKVGAKEATANSWYGLFLKV